MNKDHMKLGIAVLKECRDAKKKLVMSGWYTRTPHLGETHNCGTAGCAIGYMTMHPHMKALGFKPSREGMHPAYHTDDPAVIYYSWEAVLQFFQISENTSSWLFLEESYFAEMDRLPENIPWKVTFDMVIARMEHILQGGEPSTF